MRHRNPRGESFRWFGAGTAKGWNGFAELPLKEKIELESCKLGKEENRDDG